MYKITFMKNDDDGKGCSKVKVCIVTLFKSLNFGAFLQAYALQQILRERSVCPVFLDLYGVRQSIKRLLVLFKPKDITWSGIVFSYKKWKIFSISEKKYLSVDSSDGRCSAYIVGSDEVWNISNSSFVPAPEFFGNHLPSDRKCFSYAPSCGNSDVSRLLSDGERLKGVMKFERISVRDENTYNFAVKARPELNIVRVLDPTFLYDFSGDEEEVVCPDKYCVLYSYKMSQEKISEILRYAKRNGLVLVSPGFHNSWCDHVIPCSPFQFLTLLKNAHSVITDTYHGTIFSIKYRKNFVSYYEGKEKVRYLLEDLGLEESGYVSGMLDQKEDIETDYSFFDSVVVSKLKLSNQFLDGCISVLEK